MTEVNMNQDKGVDAVLADNLAIANGGLDPVPPDPGPPVPPAPEPVDPALYHINTSNFKLTFVTKEENEDEWRLVRAKLFAAATNGEWMDFDDILALGEQFLKAKQDLAIRLFYTTKLDIYQLQALVFTDIKNYMRDLLRQARQRDVNAAISSIKHQVEKEVEAQMGKEVLPATPVPTNTSEKDPGKAVVDTPADPIRDNTWIDGSNTLHSPAEVYGKPALLGDAKK